MWLALLALWWVDVPPIRPGEDMAETPFSDEAFAFAARADGVVF